MKPLRNFIVLLTTTLFIGLSLMACNDKANSSGTCEDSDKSQEIQAMKAELDSLSNKLKDVTEKVKSLSEMNSDSQKTDSDPQNTNSAPQKTWLWILSGVAIVSFVLAIISSVRYRCLNKRLSRHRKELESLKSNKQSASFAPKPVYKSPTSPDYENLKRKVSELERRIQQLTPAPRPNPKPVEPVVKQVAQPTVQQGYFGNPIGTEAAYFKKLLVSCDSEARFSVDYSGNKATFRPLDSGTYFGTFVSNDAMRVAVDFEGCPTSQASSMQVVAPGEAELRDNKWIIIKKSIVKLS